MFKGNTHSLKARGKMSRAAEKRWSSMTFKQRQKILKGLDKTGCASHRKGITYEKEYGKEKAEKIKKEISRTHPDFSGKKHPFYGKKHSKKTKEKIKKAHLGLKASEDTKRKMSEGHNGEKSHLWKGGKSFEPYTPEFNNQLKQLIRKRDNDTCQFCGKTKEENNQELSINHINYIKEDCSHRNLIALCRGDNARANIDREKWQFLFETLQEIRQI